MAADLKKENAALKKENKHLKTLLQDALVIIRKLKEHVDRNPTPDVEEADDDHESPAKTKRRRKVAKKK